MSSEVAVPARNEVLANARDYYGKVLQKSADLKTSACCSAESVPDHHKPILAEIDDEILTRFYGCGSPIPEALDGTTVLDLGCGTGRDVFLASKLVGEQGRVIGVDMTEEQLDVARRHVDSQARRFGYSKSNVDLRHGFIEDLGASGVEDDSVDVVISNCVINLSPDKSRVYSEIYRVLRPGGELYISDVFADRRLPAELRTHPVLHGECLGGALYTEDFRRILRALGCADHRMVKQTRIDVTDAELAGLLGNTRFFSLTVRAFKLETLEDICEDYGQVATYKGTIPQAPHVFILDDHHRFEVNKPVLVCGNTASMLQETRYAPHFTVTGDRSVHYGPFNSTPVAAKGTYDSSSACC